MCAASMGFWTTSAPENVTVVETIPGINTFVVSASLSGVAQKHDLVTSDTSEGGRRSPNFAKLLCENSESDVEWLLGKFSLDLSLVARLGGQNDSFTWAIDGKQN